jgi:hypothetical protein
MGRTRFERLVKQDWAWQANECAEQGAKSIEQKLECLVGVVVSWLFQ